jgi:hypothetical protein
MTVQERAAFGAVIRAVMADVRLDDVTKGIVLRHLHHHDPDALWGGIVDYMFPAIEDG